MDVEFIKVRATFIPSCQGQAREIKGHLTPCCQPEMLMNPLLPKTIIGQNNSSLEINWTNYVGSRNPLNNYFLSGRVSVIIVWYLSLFPWVKSPQKGFPGFEQWARWKYRRGWSFSSGLVLRCSCFMWKSFIWEILPCLTSHVQYLMLSLLITFLTPSFSIFLKRPHFSQKSLMPWE